MSGTRTEQTIFVAVATDSGWLVSTDAVTLLAAGPGSPGPSIRNAQSKAWHAVSHLGRDHLLEGSGELTAAAKADSAGILAMEEKW
jgi:hypothetical protein